MSDVQVTETSDAIEMLENTLNDVTLNRGKYYDTPVIGKYMLNQSYDWTGQDSEFFDTFEEAVEAAKRLRYIECVIAKAEGWIRSKVTEYEVMK